MVSLLALLLTRSSIEEGSVRMIRDQRMLIMNTQCMTLHETFSPFPEPNGHANSSILTNSRVRSLQAHNTNTKTFKHTFAHHVLLLLSHSDLSRVASEMKGP